MPSDQTKSVIQVFDERSPIVLVARPSGHNKAQLNRCHVSNLYPASILTGSKKVMLRFNCIEFSLNQRVADDFAFPQGWDV